MQSECWEGAKRWGTGGLMELKNFLHGSLVVKNYQTTWYPDVVKIGGEEARSHLLEAPCGLHELPHPLPEDGRPSLGQVHGARRRGSRV